MMDVHYIKLLCLLHLKIEFAKLTVEERIMQFRLGFKKKFFAAVLLLGGTVSAFGGATVDGAMQAKSPEYDFTVVSVTKDQTHPHFNEGSSIAFAVNGVQGRTLVLVRGKIYTFNIDTGVMHDFYLSTNPVGWGTGTLTEGVEGNFTYKGVVTFKPTAETPDVIYYQCRNHKFMGGQIHIVNPGEEGKIKITEPAAATSAVQAVIPTVNKGELKQKLNFVDMFINKSDSAKRITASNNAEAKAKHKDAQDRLAAGKSAFDSDNLQLSKTRIDEAMGLMTEAARLVPSESMRVKAKDRFEELLQGVKGLEASYAQNYEVIVKEGGGKNIKKLDSDKIYKMVDSAKTLFEEGKYDKANETLSNAQGEVSSVLDNMLANTTRSYEMKFSSPDQEYAYELARFSSLEELFPHAIEQKQPSPAEITLMESYVKNGKEKRDQAIADAKQQNFAAALEKIKNGIEQLEEALKSIGIR